jgi:adenine-specific DNA-methyltransferase
MTKLKMQTPNKVNENVERIAALFPNCITESVGKDGKPTKVVDFDLLRQELSGFAVKGQEERYQFTWADKKKSILLANSPISKTLRPCREESVNFDTTKNLYIEGDNLEVLKLLQETYLGKVKMIYIDPPYNTGNDFVYEDDFAISAEEHFKRSGMEDEDGNRLFQNNDSNGRFHTDWLNMIYPRLKLARDLLTDDGVIFISIDDNEVHNLRKVCDEVFGMGNFVNTISIKLKNIAGASGGGEDKRLKKNMEFVLIYAKSYYQMQQFNNVYVYTPIANLVEQYREDEISWKYTMALVNSGEKEYIGSTTDGEGTEIKIYKRIKYDIQSVSTLVKNQGLSEKEVYKKYAHCIFQTAMPQSSIRPRVMKKVKELGVNSELFSIEYTPKSGKRKGMIYEQFYKGDNFRLFAWLSDVSEEKDGVLCKKDLQGTYWDFVGETKNLTKEGGVPFPNGKKSVKMLQQMLEMQTDKNSIILDFFSGSATTAHAVMQLNVKDGGNRKFIMVQLLEKIDEKEEEFIFLQSINKPAYICEIGKERIRRAGKKIADENRLTAPNLDIGFRVLKVDSSNMKPVFYNPETVTQDLLSQHESNIKEDRTPEDLLFQVMLDMGVDLASTIIVEQIGDRKVFAVGENNLICCFDENVTKETVTEIAKRKPLYAVFRDSGFERDDVMISFDQIFETYSPATERRVV